METAIMASWLRFYYNASQFHYSIFHCSETWTRAFPLKLLYPILSIKCQAPLPFHPARLIALCAFTVFVLALLRIQFPLAIYRQTNIANGINVFVLLKLHTEILLLCNQHKTIQKSPDILHQTFRSHQT